MSAAGAGGAGPGGAGAAELRADVITQAVVLGARVGIGGVARWRDRHSEPGALAGARAYGLVSHHGD